MGYRIVKTDAFQRDLDGVIAYIARSLENRTAAASLLDAVEKCYGDLERMPLMYEACRDPYLNALGYRKAGIHNYVMVYKVDEAAKQVMILRLFHGKQDYAKLI